jgi:hypothetical protein
MRSVGDPHAAFDALSVQDALLTADAVALKLGELSHPRRNCRWGDRLIGCRLAPARSRVEPDDLSGLYARGIHKLGLDGLRCDIARPDPQLCVT